MSKAITKTRSPSRFLTGVAIICLAAFCLAAQGFAQPSPPALPENVRAALADVQDFTLDFSNLGFYAVLEYVHDMPGSPGLTSEPVKIDDWTDLLERPDDFRGLPLEIEGVVGRNKSWRFQQPRYARLGQIWQLEISRRGQPLAVTAILTEDTGDVPVGARVRLSGYFVMIRQYYDSKNRPRQAALIVGHGPTVVERIAAAAKPASSYLAGGIVTVCVALVIVWLLLRGSLTARRTLGSTPESTGPAPMNLSQDLADWASDEKRDPDSEDDPRPTAP